MFFAVRFTLSQSSPPVRNATHLRTFCFLDFIFAFREIFVDQHVLLQLDLHWESLKLPWGMKWICGHSDLKTILMNHYAFRETLSCATRSLDLCILFKFIFLYLKYIPPHSCAFHTFCFTLIFSYVHYHAEYFSNPWWSVDRRKLVI